MTLEEFKKLKPGTRITEDQLKEIRAHIEATKKLRYGDPTGCLCKKCGIEYHIHAYDVRCPIDPPNNDYTDISCGCGVLSIKEFLSK